MIYANSHITTWGYTTTYDNGEAVEQWADSCNLTLIHNAKLSKWLGYTTTDDNGEAVEQWADSCNLTLIHNAKLSKWFNSARWMRGYNPDLIFVSEGIDNMCRKSVMEPIPHTQHRPICVRADTVIVAHPTPFRRRFNIWRADWNGYSAALDKLIEDVEPIPEKYGGFVENVRVASRRYIPRGCRRNYIPGLSEESKSMYEDYKTQYTRDPFDNSTIETGDALINNMKEEEMEGDHHNNQHEEDYLKSFQRPSLIYPPCLVSANQVSHQLLINTRGTMFTKPKRPALPPTILACWTLTSSERLGVDPHCG